MAFKILLANVYYVEILHVLHVENMKTICPILHIYGLILYIMIMHLDHFNAIKCLVIR